MEPNQNPAEAPAQAVGGVPPADPGYSYDDLSKQSIREVIEGTPPPVEPVAPTEPVTPEEPEIPLEKVIEDTTRRTVQEIEDQRKADEKAAEPPVEPTPKEQAYLDWEQKFKDEKSRPPTYLEALSFVEEQAIATIEERNKAEQERVQTEQKAQQDRQADEEKRVNTIVDDELGDLYNAGKLTKVQDPNNPYDQGVAERKALFQAWADVNNARRAKGLPDIISATRIFYGADETGKPYYTRPNVQPAGANAPVQGNRGSSVPPSSEQSYSYTDLKKPWAFFRRGQ